MIKRVLGQPNFSPKQTQLNNSKLSLLFHRKFKLVPFVQLNTTYIFVLTLTDDKLLKFVLILGKSCVAFVWGEKLGWPRTLFIILLALSHFATESQNRLTFLASSQLSSLSLSPCDVLDKHATALWPFFFVWPRDAHLHAGLTFVA